MYKQIAPIVIIIAAMIFVDYMFTPSSWVIITATAFAIFVYYSASKKNGADDSA